MISISDVNDLSFDKEQKQFYKVLLVYMLKAFKRGGQRAFDEFKPKQTLQEITGGFEIEKDGEAERFLQTYALKLSGRVTDEIETEVKTEIMTGLNKGENISKIEKRIRDVFDATRYRAELIARTEMARAVNVGRLEGYKRAGVEKVQFIVAGDERTCIFGGRTKVITKEGLKPISKIKKGDLVLTHKDRYRKVLRTFKHKTKKQIVRIRGRGRRKNGVSIKVSLTEDHPIMVERNQKKKWILAGQILKSDKIMIFAKKCNRCKKLTPIGNKYCSLSCASKVGNKIRWSREGERDRRSELNRELGLQKIMREAYDKKYPTKKSKKHIYKKQSKTMKKKYRDDEDFHRYITKCNQEKAKADDWGWKNTEHLEMCLKLARKAIGKKHLGQTFIEQKVGWWLKKQNFEFIPQYYIKDDVGRMWVDFYLPTYNLIIECDGTRWHDEEKDKIRDERLASMGYRVLRLKENEIRNHFSDCISKIMTECYNGCFIPLEIKDICKFNDGVNSKVRELTVYNLEVEEDSTFYANYILVHNCPECMDLENHVFRREEAPDLPIHANCRCTIVPYFEER